jgi:hypothetical protein
MFDRTTYVAPPSVNINVKQQPNDSADAARLYGECKAKAEAEVANATIAKFGARNELTGVVVHEQVSFIDNQQHVRLLFSLNGEKFDIWVKDDYESMTRDAYREVVVKLFDKVLQKMLLPAFTAQRESKASSMDHGGGPFDKDGIEGPNDA